jgi:hypothetical protein
MAKQVTFASNPRNKPAPEDLDAFVHGGRPPQPETTTSEVQPPAPPPKVPMKRLTFDIPADLHKRMKLACVQEGRDMAVVVREMLEARFP